MTCVEKKNILPKIEITFLHCFMVLPLYSYFSISEYYLLPREQYAALSDGYTIVDI